MKPKFNYLTPQFSIFSKYDMLWGCDISYVTNDLFFLHDMVQIYVEKYSTS